MKVLQTVIPLEANQYNFSDITRKTSQIKFIVIHYTGNIGDTARNNAMYFHEAKIQSSAHYFVSDDTIYQSVPDNHAAFAVGLGARKEPYIKWPSMWKKITNNNSISIEICGSKESREGSQKTKLTAAKLTADLLEKYGLDPTCVYRHYDVTGKICPAWAVESPFKWTEFLDMVRNEFNGKEEAEEMQNTEENYKVFKAFMKRYMEDLAKEDPTWDDTAMDYCKNRGLINDGKGSVPVTRSELATVLWRMNA